MLSEAIKEVVASNGNIRLAAERAHLTVPQLTEELLSLDEESLQSLVRKMMLLQMLDLFSNTRVALIASFDEMSDRAMVDAFDRVVAHMHSLLDVQSSERAVNQTLNVIPHPKQVNDFTLAIGER